MLENASRRESKPPERGMTPAVVNFPRLGLGQFRTFVRGLAVPLAHDMRVITPSFFAASMRIPHHGRVSASTTRPILPYNLAV